ncbi:hypothetical protein [Flavobacterium sp.]|uniref:hypothetical protein n=1 Tax=Flavobacterium sp. TaxID=239 RepID=UPI003C6A32CE
MKRIIALLSFIVLTFTSCTSNDETSQNHDTSILPKTIIYSEGANSDTTTLSYNGNKIQEITHASGYKSIYTYTDDLITNVTSYKGPTIDNTHDYTYENGKLTSDLNVNYSQNTTQTYKLKSVFTHNNDGTILEERYNVDSKTGAETKNGNSEMYTFTNGNLTKQISTSTSTYFDGIKSTTTTYTYTYIFEYDDKNNPSINILGLNKIEFFDNASKNNINKIIITERTTNGVVTSSEPTVIYYTTSYNDTNFLTESNHTDSDGNNNTIEYKQKYFYD